MYELKEELNIEDMIYEIRGKQVMLDSDLARLYECTNGTKTINQAVKRHINKFPERYMFQLTKSEYDNLKSQFMVVLEKCHMHLQNRESQCLLLYLKHLLQILLV